MRYRQNNVRKKLIPAYGIVPLLLALLWNSLAYNGARWIASGRYHYNIETVLDERIPFIPWTLVIYFGCYLFWGINYILIAGQEKESVYRFFTADAISRIVCFCFFVLFPTTNTRPEIVADGFWNQAVIWLYSIDAADNLFPSIHCLVSWFCFLGIRGGAGDSEMVSIPVLCDCSLRVFIHFDDKTACCLGCGRWCYPGADLFYGFRENTVVSDISKIL